MAALSRILQRRFPHQPSVAMRETGTSKYLNEISYWVPEWVPRADNEKVIAESPEYSEILLGEKRLCSVCEAANIVSDPVNGESEELSLRPVHEAQATRDCPLCVFAVSLYQKLGEYEREADCEFIFGIKKYLGMVKLCLWPTTPSNCSVYLGDFSAIVCRGQDTRKGLVRKRVHATIDIDLVKGWIGQCRSCHDHCRRGLPDTLSQQLLNLVNAGNLKLIDVKSLEIHTVGPDKLPPYVALSYVWNSRPLKNSTSIRPTEDATHTHLPLDTLPRTLKESILLARDLNFPYIWIDQICIDQNNKEVKKQIIPAMGAIYAGADMVMIAAAGDDIETGLPGSASNPRVKRPLLRASTSSGQCIELVEYKDFGTRITHTLWATRGWTFQEYVFARRALFVLADEMLMVCNDAVQEEMFSADPNGQPFPQSGYLTKRLLDIKKAVTSSGPLEWDVYSKIIEVFTLRDLTYEEDRLEALAGILSQADAQGGEMTLKTGLPMIHFGQALIWDTASRNDIKNRWPNSRASVNIAPSWSWGSAGRPVSYSGYTGPSPEAMEPLFMYKTSEVRNNIIGVPLQASLRRIWEESGISFWRVPIWMQDWGEGQRNHWATNLSQSCRKAWNTCRRGSRKSWQTTDLTTIFLSISPVPEQIPVIHLVTIVFYANLEYRSTDNEGYAYYKFEALHKYRTNLVMDLVVDTSRYGSLEVAKPWPFALVGVQQWRYSEPRLKVNAMMLREAGDGYYERVSICHITVANELSKLLEADESNAAWAYIKLR